MKKSITISILLLLVFSVASIAAWSSKPASSTTGKTVETTVQTTSTAGKPVETTKTTVQTTSTAGKPVETTQTTVQTTSTAGKPVETTKSTAQTTSTAGKTLESTQQTKTKILSQNVTMGVKRAYPGYLTDNYSGRRGKDKDGYDLFRNPARHSLVDIRSGSASGFGVFLRMKKGNYKFYPLDVNGTKMAQDIIVNTNRKDNIYVVVKGSIGSDGVVYTTSIQEVAHGRDKEKQAEKEQKDKLKQKSGKDKK